MIHTTKPKYDDAISCWPFLQNGKLGSYGSGDDFLFKFRGEILEALKIAAYLEEHKDALRELVIVKYGDCKCDWQAYTVGDGCSICTGKDKARPMLKELLEAIDEVTG